MDDPYLRNYYASSNHILSAMLINETLYGILPTAKYVYVPSFSPIWWKKIANIANGFTLLSWATPYARLRVNFRRQNFEIDALVAPHS